MLTFRFLRTESAPLMRIIAKRTGVLKYNISGHNKKTRSGCCDIGFGTERLILNAWPGRKD